MRETAGSAAAPAARCRKFRRGSFILNLPSHHSITSSARASSTAHRGNRASLWNWLELQFVGGRINEPEFGVGLLRNRSAEKREVFVGVRPVLPIAHSADRISDLIAEAILQR